MLYFSACPGPVFEPEGESICYFLVADDFHSDVYSRSTGLCENIDADAKMAIVDSNEKWEHLKEMDLFRNLNLSLM